MRSVIGDTSEARRRAFLALAYSCARSTARGILKEDERQTARDLRAAIIFGIVAASIELGVLLYFFR
jgi:hypothetical protein